MADEGKKNPDLNGNKSQFDKPESPETTYTQPTYLQNLRQRNQHKTYHEEDDRRNKYQMNMRDYAHQLAPWVYNYRLWAAMSTFPPAFPYQMMSCFPLGNGQISSMNGSSTLSASSLHAPVSTPRRHNSHLNHTRQSMHRLGTEYLIPPLWKRVLAELIDFVVLFYLKILIMIVVMRQMGILKTESFLNVQIEVPYFDLKNMEMDIDKAFTMTSEIIALEIVNRIMITLFETFCIWKGMRGTVGGATPGKRLLGMVVVSCDNIMDLGDGKVVVIPARDIGFISALVRSVIKNFTLAFFFPACFTVFFFQHNRAAYDILAKTVVVQLPQPVQR